MSLDNTAIHLIAGGTGGTVGAILTCPLEVVKTRLQSSVASFSNTSYTVTRLNYIPHQAFNTAQYTTVTNTAAATAAVEAKNATARSTNRSLGLYVCLKHIIQNEGIKGLFKGLGPNLVGVAPSRAIYFFSYAQSKKFLNSVITPETPLVHILSASCAGFTASTATNPIWFIKTRLQLDQKREGSLTTMQCIRNTYRQEGIRGFYKGITASYYGITETVIHFVIYEAIKAKLREMRLKRTKDNITMDFIEYMGAGATSKTIATCVAYPHEVARTRLRQDGNIYKGFWQTLILVGKQEGVPGLYRGLVTQLVRQIPNTAVMMSTYEAVVYMFTQYTAKNRV